MTLLITRTLVYSLCLLASLCASAQTAPGRIASPESEAVAVPESPEAVAPAASSRSVSSPAAASDSVEAGEARSGGSTPSDDVPSGNSVPADDGPLITYMDGFILGLVEGVTEYLPISSTGHLILTNQLLGLTGDEPLSDAAGQPILLEEIDPATGEGVPLTLQNVADAYAIIIQGGAILAVAIIYWRRLLIMVSGCLAMGRWAFGRATKSHERFLAEGSDAREGALLVRNLLAAFIPAAVLGLLFDDLIEAYLFGILPVITALFVGALLMFAVEAWRKRGVSFQSAHEGPDLHELNLRQCVIIGLLQCVAMWPGTSRSMMTIVGGYVVGLNPVRAAEFSFLLGFITLTAAAGYKTLKMGGPMLQALDIGPIVFGIVVATVSAAFAVKWLVAYLTRHGLNLFAWYRVVLAAVVALVAFG